MIALLRGRVAAADISRAIIDVGGVGYEVHAPSRAVAKWSISGDDVMVHVSTQVREDAITLFGFADPLERVAFEALIGVSGVGPRMALACIDKLVLSELRRAVERDDLRTLSSIKGVGRKTAQRLALELKGKLPIVFEPEAGTAPPGAENRGRPQALTLALERLGYNRAEIARARSGLDDADVATDAPVADQLRAALRLLYETKG